MFFIHQESDFLGDPSQKPIAETINLLRAQVTFCREAQAQFRERVSESLPNLVGATSDQLGELMLLSRPSSPTFLHLREFLQAA